MDEESRPEQSHIIGNDHIARPMRPYNYKDPENIKKVKLIFDNRDEYYDIEEMLASEEFERRIVVDKSQNFINRDDRLRKVLELARKGTNSMSLYELKEFCNSIDN